jgi:predicted PurR-regulated permease PerM
MEPTPTPEEMPAAERAARDQIIARRKRQSERRVILDPTTPSAPSIARVVILTLLLVGIGGFVATMLSALTHLLFIVVLSVFFAYLIDPIVRLIRMPFEAIDRPRVMPRSAAIVIAYILVFSAIGMTVTGVAPSVGEQAQELGTSLPGYATTVQRQLRDLNRRFERLRLPEGIETDIEHRAAGVVTYVSESIGNTLLTLLAFLPWLLLIPILAFFFLKDVNTVRLAVLRTFPAGTWRIRAELVLQDLNSTLAAYTRAQLLSCLVIGIICTIAFYVFGLKYALLLGLLAGIFEFVPLIGPLTIAIVAVLTTAASNDGWTALYVALFLAVLRVGQDYFIYPRIVRGGIHLHPLVIILAVLAGEQVAGIPGVFLSIPIIAILTVLYKHILEHQGRRTLISHWFEGNPADDSLT